LLDSLLQEIYFIFVKFRIILAMGVVDTCIKYFLFLTNFLVFILSIAVLGLGIWVLVDRNSFLDLLDQTNASVPIYTSAAVLFLIVSISSIVISFLGCCGAYKENKCMLVTYFVLILALLVLITVGAVIGMAQGVDKLTDPFLDTLSKYDEESNTPIEQTWNQVQKDLQCCGVMSPRDWSINNERYGTGSFVYGSGSNSGLMNVMVPPSCCAGASDVDNCRVAPTPHNQAYVQGCFALVETEINNHINAVGGVAITVIVVMVVNMLISFYMCSCGLDDDAEPRPKKRYYGQPSGQSRA